MWYWPTDPSWVTTPDFVSSLREQLATTILASLQQFAQNLSLVIQNSPQGDIQQILNRPDVTASLNASLASARAQALSVLQQAWLQHAPDTTSQLYQSLAADVEKACTQAPDAIRTAVTHAFTGIPDQHFTVGTSKPGTNPQREVAAQRAQAARNAVDSHAQSLALRNGLSVDVAHSGSRTEDILDQAGIPPGAQFPHPVPIGGKKPPKLYQGVLHGPPLHPHCRCRLEQIPGGVQWVASMDGKDPRSCAWCKALHGEILWAPGQEPGEPEPATGEPQPVPDLDFGQPEAPAPAEPPMVSSADIAAMPEERYQSLTDFLRAALHELAQVIKAILGIGNG